MTAKTSFTCPTHPEIRRPVTGTCPKCGMSLVPATEDDAGERPAALPKSA